MASVLPRFANVFHSDEPIYEPHVDQETEEDFLKNACSNRKHTDVPFLVLQGAAIFILLFFFTYCIVHGDIDRIIKGYDHCGNICGKFNDFSIDFETCKAENMTAKPFLNVDHQCTSHCDYDSVTSVIGQRCISKEFKKEITSSLLALSRDLHTCKKEIVQLCFIALGFCIIILLMLRYMVEVFVWMILLGVVLVCLALTGYCWYLTDDPNGTMTPVAIIATIITIVIILVILVLRKRIQLVIQLFKEAGKSIAAMPLLLFQPFLTFIAIAAVLSNWAYFALWIHSAGTPVKKYYNVEFRQNGIIHFSYWYNHFVMIWLIQFVYGCQNMILAGAISTWYFCRNKTRLGNPLYNSAINTVKYHLGTVSLGSLIIALIHIINLIFKSMRRSLRCRTCLCLCCLYRYFEDCLSYLEILMIYFSRNAYIVTYIYGTDFLKSGIKAYKLLTENVLRIIVINSVGDFIFILSKLFVVSSTVIIGVLLLKDKEHVEYKWVPITIAGLIAFIISHCFLCVYEMAIDTIFICFCEDCKINDGISRPYFMSQDLMKYVENSRKILGIVDPQEIDASRQV